VDRNKTIRIAAVSLSLVLALGVIELVSFTYLQFSKRNTPQIRGLAGFSTHVADPIYGHALKRGYQDSKFQVNSDGLRSSMKSVEENCKG